MKVVVRIKQKMTCKDRCFNLFFKFKFLLLSNFESMSRRKDNEFHFKQFSVRHDQSTMKVGTDAVLLGAWVDLADAKQILEVGTGSGVISLILAQRSSFGTKIEAIEIDSKSVVQAKENVGNSPWLEKITISQSRFQEWKPKKKYDLIVSNPPFFSNSLLPPNSVRTGARHSVSLTPQELLKHAKELLPTYGRLAIILPYNEGNRFIEEASKFEFYLNKQMAFFTRKDKPQERWLLDFSFQEKPISFSSITLYDEVNNLSKEYKQLTSEFYLNR